MKLRKAKFEELKKEVEIIIRTKCPDKWLFVDRETGDTWKWDYVSEKFTRT